MKNEFIIKKDAFITCFTPFITANNKRDVIAYSALLKKDITADFERIKLIYPKLGIDELNIFYIVKKDYDIEFYKELIEFQNKIIEFQTQIPDSKFNFKAGLLEVYFELILKEYIDIYKGEYNTQNSLFIFYGFDWCEIVFQFKKFLNVNISGGSTTKRHLLSHLNLRLNSYLFGLTLNYNILKDSIIFDNVDKNKILPKLNLKEQNFNLNLKKAEEFLSNLTKKPEENKHEGASGKLTNSLNISNTPQKRQFHSKILTPLHSNNLKENLNSNISLITYLNNKHKKYFSTHCAQKLKCISVEPNLNFILPALNLANCWKPLYKNISQSAGNLLSLNFLENFRGHTPKYFGCRFLSVKRSFSLFTTVKSIHTDCKGKYLNKPLFSYYLTGLIEGDGSIITPKKLRSPNGKLNYPSIQIVFNLKDLPLALLIQKELTFGSLSRKKGVNAYVLTINSYEGILSTISLINGNMRTPKIYSLNALIDFFNKTKGTSIEKYPVSKEPLDSNPWLSGFIEADASFQVRTTLLGKYPKLECKLEITQRRVDHKGYDNLDFLSDIAEFLYTEVKKIRSDKSKPEYRVRTTNIKGNIKAKNYLLQFPLFGTKYLDSLDWMKIVDIFDRKEHNTDEGKEKIVKIKSGMNNFRTDFTWDHLQKFYNVKI